MKWKKWNTEADIVRRLKLAPFGSVPYSHQDTGIIDLVLIGNINRKIRTLSLTADEYKQLTPNLDSRPNFVLWQRQEINVEFK